jgi:hypothetical protein
VRWLLKTLIPFIFLRDDDPGRRGPSVMCRGAFLFSRGVCDEVIRQGGNNGNFPLYGLDFDPE